MNEVGLNSKASLKLVGHENKERKERVGKIRDPALKFEQFLLNETNMESNEIGIQESMLL